MNVSLKINKEVANLLIKKYKKYQLESTNEYIVFFAQFDYSTITLFKNKKNPNFTLTITGKKEASIEKIFHDIGLEEYPIEKPKTDPLRGLAGGESDQFIFLEDQIGSDEVGTGDFFGPVTVAASLVKKSDIPYLKKIGVCDSKKISDKRIREIAKKVISKFPYSSLTLDNKKYNELTDKGYNEAQIKVLMHNRALFNLKTKYPNIKNIYVDQFVPEDRYYFYLKNEKKTVHDIYFHTKGESYFPSVALASVIARYSFLIHMDELNKKYNTEIPFGASRQIEDYAVSFTKKHGIKELDKIVKKHFKTYQRVIEKLNK